LRTHHQEIEDQPDRDEHEQRVCQNILHTGSGRAPASRKMARLFGREYNGAVLLCNYGKTRV
jgi:hypothetical protein